MIRYITVGGEGDKSNVNIKAIVLKVALYAGGVVKGYIGWTLKGMLELQFWYSGSVMTCGVDLKEW